MPEWLIGIGGGTGGMLFILGVLYAVTKLRDGNGQAVEVHQHTSGVGGGGVESPADKSGSFSPPYPGTEFQTKNTCEGRHRESNRRVDRLEDRFEKRLDQIDRKMDERFDKLAGQLGTQIDARFDKLADRIKGS